MNEPNHEAVCLWERSSYTYQPYVPGTDPQAMCLATTVQTKTWGFCAQIFGAASATDKWGVAYTGYFTTTSVPFTDMAYTGLPVYYTTAMRGTRAYKNYVSNYNEIANIIFLQVGTHTFLPTAAQNSHPLIAVLTTSVNLVH